MGPIRRIARQAFVYEHMYINIYVYIVVDCGFLVLQKLTEIQTSLGSSAPTEVRGRSAGRGPENPGSCGETQGPRAPCSGRFQMLEKGAEPVGRLMLSPLRGEHKLARGSPCTLP